MLRVTLQPDARPKGIAADLLLALGDPAWSSGTVQTLTNRAVRLLQHCGVELIVLDESLPLAELAGLAEPELAGRFHLACLPAMSRRGLSPL